MSVATIRTAIASKIDAVADTENVKDFVIWTDDWNYIITNMAKDGRINTWMVGLQAIPEIKVGNGWKETVYIFRVVAYYSIKTSNESSKAFENIIDNVVNDFSKSKSFLSGTYNDPMLLVANEAAVYVQQPCHRALLNIRVTEKETQDKLC